MICWDGADEGLSSSGTEAFTVSVDWDLVRSKVTTEGIDGDLTEDEGEGTEESSFEPPK